MFKNNLKIAIVNKALKMFWKSGGFKDYVLDSVYISADARRIFLQYPLPQET